MRISFRVWHHNSSKPSQEEVGRQVIVTIVWQCQERYRAKGVQGCTNRHVDEAILEQAFTMAWNALIDNRDEIRGDKGTMGDTC